MEVIRKRSVVFLIFSLLVFQHATEAYSSNRARVKWPPSSSSVMDEATASPSPAARSAPHHGHVALTSDDPRDEVIVPVLPLPLVPTSPLPALQQSGQHLNTPELEGQGASGAAERIPPSGLEVPVPELNPNQVKDSRDDVMLPQVPVTPSPERKQSVADLNAQIANEVVLHQSADPNEEENQDVESERTKRQAVTQHDRSSEMETNEIPSGSTERVALKFERKNVGKSGKKWTNNVQDPTTPVPPPIPMSVDDSFLVPGVDEANGWNEEDQHLFVVVNEPTTRPLYFLSNLLRLLRSYFYPSKQAEGDV